MKNSKTMCTGCLRALLIIGALVHVLSLGETRPGVQEYTRMPALGKHDRSSVNMVLPPLKGVDQAPDSDANKNMFKELSAERMHLLFSTCSWRVENGAATGYMGRLNSVSNLTSNTMQAQDDQLKLVELPDDTEKMKQAYIQKVKKAFDNEQKKTWPAPLHAAVGDSTDFKVENNQGMEKLPQP